MIDAEQKLVLGLFLSQEDLQFFNHFLKGKKNDDRGEKWDSFSYYQANIIFWRGHLQYVKLSYKV